MDLLGVLRSGEEPSLAGGAPSTYFETGVICATLKSVWPGT
jgi:hypothetical protein